MCFHVKESNNNSLLGGIQDNRVRITRSVHLHMHDVLTVPLTVQLQAWRVHCPISAQIGLLMTNHVREFCYSFD